MCSHLVWKICVNSQQTSSPSKKSELTIWVGIKNEYWCLNNTKLLTVLHHGFAGSPYLLFLLCILSLKVAFVCNFQMIWELSIPALLRRHLYLGLLSFHALWAISHFADWASICNLGSSSLEAQWWRMESIYIVKVKIDKVMDEIGRHHGCLLKHGVRNSIVFVSSRIHLTLLESRNSRVSPFKSM